MRKHTSLGHTYILGIYYIAGRQRGVNSCYVLYMYVCWCKRHARHRTLTCNLYELGRIGLYPTYILSCSFLFSSIHPILFYSILSYSILFSSTSLFFFLFFFFSFSLLPCKPNFTGMLTVLPPPLLSVAVLWAKYLKNRDTRKRPTTRSRFSAVIVGSVLCDDMPISVRRSNRSYAWENTGSSYN